MITIKELDKFCEIHGKRIIVRRFKDYSILGGIVDEE